MTEPAPHVPFWKQRRVLRMAVVVVAAILVVFGVFQLFKSPVDDVKWGYLAYAMPGAGHKLPLYPDRHPDRETLSQSLTWIEQAKEVTDQKLSWPRRSEQLVLIMKDGRTFSVDNAQTCKSTGPGSSMCSYVKNMVTIQDSNRKPEMYFAESPELTLLLQKAERDFKPINMANYPKSVTVGSTFRAAGDGWLTDKVTVSLKIGNTVLWSGVAVPDHGHFSIQAKCPSDVVPGEYELEYAGEDWVSMGNYIKVEKP